MKTTLVIGASPNPDRSSFDAIETLVEKNHPVIALGVKSGLVSGVEILTDPKAIHSQNIHTIGLYINPTLQKEYYDFILGLKPERIFFNPGTENPEFLLIAKAAGIECLDKCMVVTLNQNEY